MNKIIVILCALALSLTGCASVNTASFKDTNEAKKFNPPSEGKAGVYIYRKDTIVGAALKKDVYINGECIGETAKGVFFYKEVDGDTEHKISTESEFSPNDIVVYLESGLNYFFEQYLKLGVFVGGAGLEKVEATEGMNEVSKLQLASAGKCSSSYTN